MKIQEDKLEEYIKYLASNPNLMDISILDEISKKISVNDYPHYGKKVLSYIERENDRLNINTLDIKQSDINKIIKAFQKLDRDGIVLEYINKTLSNNDRFKTFQWEDDLIHKTFTDSLISKILSTFYWLNKIDAENKILISQPRDKHKILDAIELLKRAFDNPQLTYELEEAKKSFAQKRLTKSIVLKSFFYITHKLLSDEAYSINLSATTKATDIANTLILDLFNNNTNYRQRKSVIKFKYNFATFYYYQ